MIYNFIWNGIKGKGKKFFVRNIGGMPLYIYSSSFINSNSRLENNFSGFNSNEFYHHMHPWKLRPETTKYHNVDTSPLIKVPRYFGSNTFMVEHLPLFYGQTNYLSPYFHPTHVAGTESVFRLRKGPFLTNPPGNINAQSQPLLSGYNIRDYYRLDRRVELKNYNSFFSQIEIDVVCVPPAPGIYNAQLKFYYDGIDSFHDQFSKSFTLNCKFDATGVNFEELDWTNRVDIFSVEGYNIAEQVGLDHNVIEIQ